MRETRNISAFRLSEDGRRSRADWYICGAGPDRSLLLVPARGQPGQALPFRCPAQRALVGSQLRNRCGKRSPRLSRLWPARRQHMLHFHRQDRTVLLECVLSRQQDRSEPDRSRRHRAAAPADHRHRAEIALDPRRCGEPLRAFCLSRRRHLLSVAVRCGDRAPDAKRATFRISEETFRAASLRVPSERQDRVSAHRARGHDLMSTITIRPFGWNTKLPQIRMFFTVRKALIKA